MFFPVLFPSLNSKMQVICAHISMAPKWQFPCSLHSVGNRSFFADVNVEQLEVSGIIDGFMITDNVNDLEQPVV